MSHIPTPNRWWLLLTTGALAFACGGATLDENQAGGDGWLDHESPPEREPPELAHDGHCAWTGNPFVGVTTERAYTMLYETEQGDCHELPAYAVAEEKVVWGLDAEAAIPEPLIDVSGHEDVRLLDTSEGLLLMGEVEGTEQLYRIDHDSLAVLGQADTTARFWGTRTSNARRWVAVADNAATERFPIHVIDPATLEYAELDPGGPWCEAMWLAGQEKLAAIVMDEAYATARLVVWDFTDVGRLPSLGVGDGGAPTMPTPTFDVAVPGVSPAIGLSFSWIGIDPLDRTVVFPVVRNDTGRQHLLLLDLTDGTVRHTAYEARGPVAFTPDGASIVAWAGTEENRLVVIDPITLDSEKVRVPIDGVPEYFVSHDGSDVLVADVFGQDRLVIVDLETGEQTVLDAAIPLATFSSRIGHDEIWLVDDGLWRIDLADPMVEEIPLSWTPGHVVWMPQADLLFLDDAVVPRMILWDPETRETVIDAPLDGTFRAAPRLSLAVAHR